MHPLDQRGCVQAVSRLVQCARTSLQRPTVGPPRVILRRISERRSLHHSSPRTAVPPGISSKTDAVPNHHSVNPTVPEPPRSQRYGRASLPVTCPGCGALSQEAEASSPGHYTRSRKSVKDYLHRPTPESALESHGETASNIQAVEDQDAVHASLPATAPLCDRCHDLVHSSRGASIDHPSIEDIADSIAESPFKRNHVYHVLDAADFPMSLIPSIYTRLSLAKPRGQNRRSQHNYTTRPTMSFIITRSDLLAPTKEKVDALMPYFREVLRKALGGAGDSIRLGNIHLVSAKRGWWTSEIKEEIWQRGGGNWMVGKFNVGKSNLFEVLFPKGSGERAPVYAELRKQQDAESGPLIPDYLPESQLLPPPQPEVPFPALPLVSSLPGTTASPIRLPFGGKKGELIDMPGLERGNLDNFVHPDHKLDLVMTSRASVKQYNIKPGQSLLLGGGVVRITPTLEGSDPSAVMIAYPFVPLEAHVTSTEKATGTQQQERESGIETILADGAGAHVSSAGSFSLDTDVTKHQARELLRSGIPISQLPFRVYSIDLLIQGVGWVELVCQVRRRKRNEISISDQPLLRNDGEAPPESDLSMPSAGFRPFAPRAELQFGFPQVEVFTPNGEHVSTRRPMGAWTIWKEGKLPRNRNIASRPRKPMSGNKLQKKRQAKAQLASS